MAKEVKIQINMTKKALMNYMFINSTKKLGIVAWIIGFIGLILLPVSIMNQDWRLMALSGIIVYMNFVAKPLTFKSNATRQIEFNESFQQPIYYTFQEKGVFMSQAAGDGLIEWDSFLRIENKFALLLLYVTEDQAFIVIKDQIAKEDLDNIKEIIKAVPELKHNLKR